MRPIDADRLAEGLKMHYQNTDQKYEADRRWAVGYNAGLDRALYSIAHAKTIASQPNGPLTLEELRKMPLQEWLWVEIVRPTKRQQMHEVVSGYYRIYEDYTDGEALCCGFPGMTFEFEYDEYEKNWAAYRRNPEDSP